jgi:hypothetical protein
MGKLSVLLLHVSLLLPAAAQEPKVDFSELGARFAQARAPGASSGEELYARHSVQLRLGMVELAYPSWDLSDKAACEELRASALAILAVQRRWAEVLASPEDAAAIGKDAQLLEGWIKGWKAPQLLKLLQLKPSDSRELLAALGAGADVQQAAQSFAARLMDPAVCGLAPKDGNPQRVLLAPRRKDFVDLMGFAGRADSALQSVLWTREATLFTSFWIGPIFVLALEYPPWTFDPSFATCISMNRFEKNGMQQHTLREILGALHWACLGEPGDARYFLQSQALLLTIDVCGEANALEGDGERGTTGAQTQPYERFVPGGDPNGGTLPPIPAAPLDSLRENHWREGKGADHFALPLRKGQKAAQKAMIKDRPAKLDPAVARNPDAHFLLTTPDGVERTIVSAPFLGAATANKPYPPHALLVDYREFFRAYRTAFFHWLATQYDPKNPKLCAEKRRELARKLAAKDPSTSFEALVQQVYGEPLSAPEGSKPSLEWRFLEWLGKGR